MADEAEKLDSGTPKAAETLTACDFKGTTFNERADFLGATFNERADFAGALH